jgi:hypothetical protein
MAAKTNIRSEILDELLAGRDPKSVSESDGLLDDLTHLAHRAKVIDELIDTNSAQSPAGLSASA